jgi:hypothetical protein
MRISGLTSGGGVGVVTAVVLESSSLLPSHQGGHDTATWELILSRQRTIGLSVKLGSVSLHLAALWIGGAMIFRQAINTRWCVDGMG